MAVTDSDHPDTNLDNRSEKPLQEHPLQERGSSEGIIRI
jgi:hypothetical protein